MITMMHAILSWRLLVLALLVFGFAPGATLRLIVLMYMKDDPRRDELIAELYVVPRTERPFWVMEQLETAIFEGLKDRLIWAATGRVIDRWHLASGVERHRLYPKTFDIPSDEDKAQIRPGDDVRLSFEMKNAPGERMWVEVVRIKRRRIVGRLKSQPVIIPKLWSSDKIKFKT